MSDPRRKPKVESVSGKLRMAKLGLASRWVLKRRNATIGWMEMPDTASGSTKVQCRYSVPYGVPKIRKESTGDVRNCLGIKLRGLYQHSPNFVHHDKYGRDRRKVMMAIIRLTRTYMHLHLLIVLAIHKYL